MKGIILAGGNGTRLYPITQTVNKQLLPIWDKPMIYYPLSSLMLAGIKDILIICKDEDLGNYSKLLGDGSNIGCNISYKVQHEPNGLAQAFVLGESFIGNDDVALILGDNLFHGNGLSKLLQSTVARKQSTIFAYKVDNPSDYGVVEFDEDMKAISLEEKPSYPKSHWAIPGLYFYTNDVVEIAKTIEPSERGEYEITDVNKVYLERGQLNVCTFGRGFSWLDTGTIANMYEASNFIGALEKRQDLKIGCIEEVALRMGYIDGDSLLEVTKEMPDNEYKRYLLDLSNEF
jgi:glucose-1-phosphate thymidylyltransferase